ncbi:MAG TPA: carboxylating nicotinate-nucleotide diphosphorylase [Sedimentisphaerales bacterium]|nr:carboxylating nicotinate-nucleotide diphosphorylase [Sedimentisphaerales bacterium]
MKPLDIAKVRPLIEMAIEEDYGSGDPTSIITIPASAKTSANIVSREEIVVCGMPVAREVLRHYDKRLRLRVLKGDGKKAGIGETIAVISGPARPMFSAERVVLNFLQRLSAIATMTYRYVNSVKGTRARIYDTRKTAPGWRELDKYAVRCGGGYNHRYGLGDAVMIKDNHFAQLGPRFDRKLLKMVDQARNTPGVKFVCVEVDHIDDQLDKVLNVPGVDVILLDNMGQRHLRRAVEMRDRMCGKNRKPKLEASGNITLNNVRAIAASGVDRISIGAITHSAGCVDIGLDRENDR